MRDSGAGFVRPFVTPSQSRNASPAVMKALTIFRRRNPRAGGASWRNPKMSVVWPGAPAARKDGPGEYILGHGGDQRTAKLVFHPGCPCGYSTHALAHAALVCETVTGKPYDQFAIEALFRPIGVEHWWFQYYESDGPSRAGEGYGRHPSHGMGMPA